MPRHKDGNRHHQQEGHGAGFPEGAQQESAASPRSARPATGTALGRAKSKACVRQPRGVSGVVSRRVPRELQGEFGAIAPGLPPAAPVGGVVAEAIDLEMFILNRSHLGPWRQQLRRYEQNAEGPEGGGDRGPKTSREPKWRCKWHSRAGTSKTTARR